ncbi:hypothetical protein GUJ93_ZPchr0005g15458 [Zizania palustris]|uniref:Uncharacterized protein n=1 Tax=Zizania palustris TaxID=103762 RepID=A0A8J5SM52_ZIZPA|nr:hypothetical protein GUJ93_ZPchr0005g15458 [Zizania palustris]
MDVEVPLITEAFDGGVEVERSVPEVEAAGSELRMVASDAEVVALEQSSSRLGFEGSQDHERDFEGLFTTSGVCNAFSHRGE